MTADPWVVELREALTVARDAAKAAQVEARRDATVWRARVDAVAALPRKSPGYTRAHSEATKGYDAAAARVSAIDASVISLGHLLTRLRRVPNRPS